MAKPFVKNAADEEQVKDADVKVKRGIERHTADVKAVLATAEGRRLIWRYIEICGVFSLSFTGNSETYFREGQRNVGLQLLADVMEASPETYLQMVKDSKGDKDV